MKVWKEYFGETTQIRAALTAHLAQGRCSQDPRQDTFKLSHE